MIIKADVEVFNMRINFPFRRSRQPKEDRGPAHRSLLKRVFSKRHRFGFVSATEKYVSARVTLLIEAERQGQHYIGPRFVELRQDDSLYRELREKLNVHATDRIAITPGISETPSKYLVRPFPFGTIVIRAANKEGRGARYFEMFEDDAELKNPDWRSLYYKVLLRCADEVQMGKVALAKSESHVPGQISEFYSDLTEFILDNSTKERVFTLDAKNIRNYLGGKYAGNSAFWNLVQEGAKRRNYTVKVVEPKSRLRKVIMPHKK